MMRTTPPSHLYEADFYAWTRQQAMGLRRFANTRPKRAARPRAHCRGDPRFGQNERDTAYSLARQMIQLLLLIEHSPAIQQRRHWMDEVDEGRAQIKRKLSPTIRRHLGRDLRELYADGRRLVERKMRRYGEERTAAALPESCPYTLDQVLGDWLPEVELPSA